MALPCSILKYIPQTSRMAFAQTLLVTDFSGLHSKAVIPADHVFLDEDGQLADIALVEYLNQLAGAARCYNDSECNDPRMGFFVGIQNAVFHEKVYKGDELDFYGELTDSLGTMDFVSGTVKRGETLVAEFVTKLFYLAHNNEQFDFPTFAVVPQETSVFSETGDHLKSSLQRSLVKSLHEMKIEDKKITLSLACPLDFAAFDGHFKDSPLLPGVSWGEIALLAAQLLKKRQLKLQSVKKMKISGKLFPNQLFTCTVTLTPTDSSVLLIKVSAKDENGQELVNFYGTCN